MNVRVFALPWNQTPVVGQNCRNQSRMVTLHTAPDLVNARDEHWSMRPHMKSIHKRIRTCSLHALEFTHSPPGPCGATSPGKFSQPRLWAGRQPFGYPLDLRKDPRALTFNSSCTRVKRIHRRAFTTPFGVFSCGLVGCRSCMLRRRAQSSVLTY